VTWSNTGPDENIDMIGMVRAPNAANGNLMHELAAKHDLTDLFRVLNPLKCSYSYSPFGSTRKNKSRLDFFLVKTNLLSNVRECGVFPGKLSTQFDHKPVFLSFKHKKSAQVEGLKNWFMDDEAVKISTELAALQVYTRFLNPEENNRVLALLPEKVNQMSANIVQIMKIKEEIAKKYDGECNFENHLVDARIAEHRTLMADIPDWLTLSNLSKTCDDKEFFVELIEHISRKVSGTQKKLNRNKNL
jgi:hypothetical protein